MIRKVFFTLTFLLLSDILKDTNAFRPCPVESNWGGYRFFSRNETMELINSTYDPGVGFQRLRCQISKYYSNDSKTHTIKRYFYYSDINRLRLVGDTGYARPDQSGALFTMHYYKTGKKYNYMNSTDGRSSFNNYRLLPPAWLHLYTKKNCTVVQVLSKSPSTHLRSSTRVHCQLWAVSDLPLINITAEHESSTIIYTPRLDPCCQDFFKRHCFRSLYTLQGNQCVSAINVTRMFNGRITHHQ